MKVNTLMIITAIVALVFGLGFALVPSASIGLYGNSLDATGLMIARYLGATLLGLAVLAWLNKDAPAKGVMTGFFVAMVLGFLVSLYDAFFGTHNGLVWLNVVIYLLLAVGFGSFTFGKAT